MRYRFNPPPNWPALPHRNWWPPAGWTPPAAWGPPPDGWQLWVPERPNRKPVWITVGVVGVLFVAAIAVGAGEDGGSTAVGASGAPTATSNSRPGETTDVAATPTETDQARSSRPAPTSYRRLTARKWRQIVKNPDAHVGDYVVVYGEITQFDAATGDDMFLANVGGVYQRPEYGFVDYPTNTLLSGSSSKLGGLVEGDLFRAKVQVLGSETYETQIGGETTVPSLQVDHIKRLGSTS
jgi:hypothetical protein